MQKEINLKALFEVIRRRLWLIMIITVLATVASGLYSLTSKEPPPVYKSSSSILLNSDENGSTGTLEVILREPAVLSAVIEELGIIKTMDQLSNQLTFVNDGGKIVKLVVHDTDPQLAADIANTTSIIFTKQVGNILGIYDTRIVTEAQVSNTPISTGEGASLVKNIVLGFAAGLVISIGITLFLDSLDDSIRSERETEQLLELPVIGSVPKMTSRNKDSKPGHRAGLIKKR